MTSKGIGYMLLTLGVLIIIGAFVSVIMLILGSAQPIDIFDLPGIGLDPESITGIPGASSQLEFITSETVNRISNFIGHIIVMGFFASIGYKLAKLGADLIRPIYVTVQGKEFQRYPPFEASEVKKE